MSAGLKPHTGFPSFSYLTDYPDNESRKIQKLISRRICQILKNAREDHILHHTLLHR
jgi:hypothetical protein